MSEPVLSLRGVTRTYETAQGGLTVLKGVDLDLFPGELVGLIGPSGSGKSSLLHAAGLLERPTSGEIRIDGEDVGAAVEGQAADLLGRHVGELALERAGAGLARLLGRLGDAEVDDLDVALPRDEDILG